MKIIFTTGTLPAYSSNDRCVVRISKHGRSRIATFSIDRYHGWWLSDYAAQQIISRWKLSLQHRRARRYSMSASGAITHQPHEYFFFTAFADEVDAWKVFLLHLLSDPQSWALRPWDKWEIDHFGYLLDHEDQVPESLRHKDGTNVSVAARQVLQ